MSSAIRLTCDEHSSPPSGTTPESGTLKSQPSPSSVRRRSLSVRYGPLWYRDIGGLSPQGESSEWGSASKLSEIGQCLRQLTYIYSFCVDLSYLYSKLVTTYSRGMGSAVVPELESESESEDEETALLSESAKQHTHFTPGVRQFMAMYVLADGSYSSGQWLIV